MRYVMLLFLALTILMPASPAYPQRRDIWQGNVVLEIVSDSGNQFLTIPHKDFWRGGTRITKKYLEARQGEKYSIVIRNNTSERIGMVIAVDGRNIISGKKSYLTNTESMYIVNGYGYAKYEGWRTDKNTVHRFYFTDLDDSYATRTFRDSSAMGVIAVAVYREKHRPKPLYEKRKRENAPVAPSPEAAPRENSGKFRDERAGTGFGNSTYSPTIKVQFQPERIPVQKTLIKYEWRDVLCRKGILTCRPTYGNRLWDENGYAPYPPGYPAPEK